MFDQLFMCLRAVARHSTGPLLDERLRYLAYCASRGSTKSSLRLIAQHLLVFTDYLPLEAETQVSLQQIHAAADLWIKREPQPQNVTEDYYGRMRFVSDARQWLTFLGRLRAPEVPHCPYADMLNEYAQYSIHERGLSRYTIRIHLWQLEQFLSRYWQQDRPFSKISISDVDAAIARKGQQDAYTRTSIKSYVTALRSFFRYAEHRGWCTRGLAAAIMSPRLFADEGLPKGPSWTDVQQLLASTEGDLPKSIRDRAIILLFAVYGMRVGEVRALRLEDLNWERELIQVTRPKPRRTQSYPLSYSVGEAILRYLKEARPGVEYREVFLTLKAPFVPPSAASLYDVVGARLRELDVSLRHHGPHSLRHACATHLLAEGFSIKAISDHLGHRKIDTTRVYAKVDLAGLRQVADVTLGDLL
jgi:integrase/recombinase XerD